MVKRRLLVCRPLALVLGVVVLAACSAERSPYLSGVARLPVAEQPRVPSEPVIQRRPWEIWSVGRDLNGARLTAPSLLAADERYAAGDPTGALNDYLRIPPSSLTMDERPALAMRIASTQLLLDQSTRALASLSGHFRAAGHTAENVDAPFALVFGYAYGRAGDLEQSLAWFSRANRNGLGGVTAVGAAQGATYFLQAVPAERFDAVAATWTSDEFVSRLIGEERYRRGSGGEIFTVTRRDPLWLAGAPPSVVGEPLTSQVETVPIGVLLPLSGRFGNLGASTRNGIDLALQGQPDKEGIAVTYKDTGEDPAQALAVAQEAITTDRASVFIGPLLSEQVNVVTGLVRQHAASMVSFSKRSDAPLGDGVFRLGTTSESQVSSLVEAAVTRLGLRRIAVVAPSDLIGQEIQGIFVQKLRDRGLEPVYQTTYAKDDMNALVAIGQEVESYAVDGLFIPDSLTAAGRLLSSIAPGARARLRPLGLASWDNAVELANSRTILDGAVFVSLFFTESGRGAVTDFIRLYTDQHRTKPDFLAAQGFDAATLVAAAVAQQRATGARFSDALTAIGSYDGLTGRMSVDPSGEIRREFAVVELRGEKTVEVTAPVTPAFVMRGDERGAPEMPLSLDTGAISIEQHAASVESRGFERVMPKGAS